MDINDQTGIPKGVAIYARVSTDDQVERGTIQTQIGACRQYCERNGLEVIGEYTDEGISGIKAFSQRAGAKQLLTDIDKMSGSIDTILVHSIDRLSRDTLDYLQTAEQLNGRGIKLLSVNETFDDTASGKLNSTVRMGFAQFERDLIRERTS